MFGSSSKCSLEIVTGLLPIPRINKTAEVLNMPPKIENTSDLDETWYTGSRSLIANRMRCFKSPQFNIQYCFGTVTIVT